jgi:glycosyltransferase involved in cell wall biosynthesis
MSRTVAFVSTYPPARCGIATYTAQLAPAVAAAQGQSVRVFAEDGAATGEDGGVVSEACFERKDYVDAVLDAARRHRPDVVHVQHAVEILGIGSSILTLLEGLREMGVRTAITLHTVHTPFSGALERHRGIADFHRSLARVTDRIVVHDRATAERVLEWQGVPRDAISVIAHGTRLFEARDPATCRRELELPERSLDAPLFLYFGFIHPQKGLLTAIRAMRRVVQSHPRAQLLVVGSIQNDIWLNRGYLKACERYVERRGLGGSGIWRLGFVPDGVVPLCYGAADVVLLPYVQLYGSASGVVHLAMGAQRPILCSSSPKFREIAEHVGTDAVAPMMSVAGWARLMSRTTDEPRWRASLAARAAARARATSWAAVGREHAALYEEL